MLPGPRFVDLSHDLEDGMAAYPGLPRPRITAHLDHASSRSHYEGEEFYLGKVDMPANTGTYLDAPFHRFSEREDLSQLAPERLLGLEGMVVDVGDAGDRSIDGNLPEAIEGKALLFRSGWDARWGTEAYWEPGPYLAESLADRLVAAHPALVGVDFWNVDDTTSRRRPAHTKLLDAGILIVEHLCHLNELPKEGFRFFAPVLRIKRGASFPVRAFAEIETETTRS